MPARIKTHRPRHLASRNEKRQEYDRKRATEQEWRKWYQLREWRQGVRPRVLERDPFCVRCLKEGVAVPSTVANHNPPHMGDWDSFWDETKIEGVCKTCHDSTIQAEERRQGQGLPPKRKA